MDQAQSQFFADANEIVDRLSRDLEQLRAVRSQGRPRRELASRIFRHVHTLKGSAGALGLKSVSQVAHEFEGVLDGVRLGRVTIDDALLDLFEDASDAIFQALNGARGDDAGSVALTARLRAIAATSAQQGAIAGSLRSALPADIARSLSEYDLQHAREAIREGAKLFVVNAGFSIEVFDKNFREVSGLLGKTGEIIATIPGKASEEEQINFRLVYAAHLIPDEIMRRAAQLGSIAVEDIKLEAGGTPLPVELPAQPAEIRRHAFVRVELEQLDDLTSTVSDLMRDTTNALGASRPAAAEGLDPASQNLRRRFVQLEERLIKLRLVPLSDLLQNAAARAGRAAARQLGRDIEFEITGGDVGIDKSLADIIAEPLMHLVRNAVSHGIETPEERTAAGKTAAGKVRLHGFSEGSRIHISISDDGRGIDMNRVAATAAQVGIVRKPEEMSADQCLRLIFRPGFSTAAEASELSGRGIGLDIVDRAMEQAGGEVRVATEPGKGTMFTMMIPATLALVPSVVLRSGAQYYCIEAAVVVNRASLSSDMLEAARENGSITWEEEKLPLLRLRELLGESDAAEANDSGSLIVCQPSEHRRNSLEHPKRVALLVDAIAGQQETLVRSLGRYSTRWHGISGAAELLDGKIALMIDLERLIEYMNET